MRKLMLMLTLAVAGAGLSGCSSSSDGATSTSGSSNTTGLTTGLTTGSSASTATTSGTTSAGSSGSTSGSTSATSGASATGGTSGSSSYGSVYGPLAFTPAGGIGSSNDRLPDGGTMLFGNRVMAYLTAQPFVCQDLGGYPDGGSLSFYRDTLALQVAQPTGSPVTPGTYTTPTDGYTGVGVSWEHYTSTSIEPRFFKSGSVTFTQVPPANLTGSFDIVAAFADGGGETTLHGTFDLPYCPGSGGGP